jgi:signal transduction histidine kinase/CheY-like chemotaxis protein
VNLIVFLDICSTLGFGVAFFYVFSIREDHLYYQTRFLLYILMGIYFFVGVTNIMEHAGITSFFDPYEEYLEILFMPFYLFFMYLLIAKLELEKQLHGETALKKALERAESEKSKSDAILAAIGDGISIQDTDLTILYQNDTHKKMVGDHIGKFCYKAYEHKSEPCQGCPLIESFHDGNVHKAERSTPTDKGTLYVEITASPLINQRGDIYAGIEVVRDITSRVKMTEEIVRAQKLESIGLLAGGIAHDFNNLLTALLGNISLAKTYADSNDKVIAKLKAAEKASLRARDLTQQLLTFSKGGAPVKRVMNINELVRDSANFSLRGANVKCRFALSDDLWPVQVDQGQLSQVANNLVINADQAMPEGGIMAVSTENVILSSGNQMLLDPGKYILVTFADQGHGIDAEDLPRIFDPFFSTKEGGTGLGLATAFSIAKNHGGHITVESSPDSGTKFFVYLPATEVQFEDSPINDEAIYSGKGKVLIMDDDDAVRTLALEMLAHLGYKVIATSNGEEALSIYEAAIREKDPFDALILDLTVPGRMGGCETGRKILGINPTAKILISSGYSNDPVMANYEKYGFCGIVPKPYKIEGMSKKLHDILGIPNK